MKGLKDLSNRGTDLRPLMKTVSALMLTSVLENFRDQGRPRWVDLAESTKKQRAKEGHWPGNILDIHAGGLKSSIQAESDNNSAVVGSNKVYAAIQHFGGTIPIKARHGVLRLRTDSKGRLLRQNADNNLAVIASGRHKRFIEVEYKSGKYAITIPARPFLVLDDNCKKEILEAVKNHLSGAWGITRGFQGRKHG